MGDLQNENFTLVQNQTKIPLPSEGSSRYERYASKSNFYKLKENYRHKLLGDNRSLANASNLKDSEDEAFKQDVKVRRNHSSSQVYPTTKTISHRSISTESLYKSDSETSITRIKNQNGFQRYGSEKDTSCDRTNDLGYFRQSTRDSQYYSADRSYSRFSDSVIDRPKPRIVRNCMLSGFPSNIYSNVASSIVPSFTDDSKESCFIRGYEQLQQQMQARRIEVERMTAARESIADFYQSKPDRRLEPMYEKGQMFPPISPSLSLASSTKDQTSRPRERVNGLREQFNDRKENPQRQMHTRQETFNLTDDESPRPPLSNVRKPHSSQTNNKSSKINKPPVNQNYIENKYHNREPGVIIEEDELKDYRNSNPASRRKKNSKKSRSSPKND